MSACERWIQECPEYAHEVRCGKPARLVVIPDLHYSYAWWACEDHAMEALASGRVRVVIGPRDRVAS